MRLNELGRRVLAELVGTAFLVAAVIGSGIAASRLSPSDVGPVVAQVLAERGLSIASHVPTKLDHGLVESADVVVTMGCGETCPVFPGKRYEDWPVADPKDQDLPAVRAIVDDVDHRVRQLLTDLDVPVTDQRREGRPLRQEADQ